jgi:hypothetical protein
MQVRVFSPPQGWQASAQPRNNDSLVLCFRYGDSNILLEGDAEVAVEQRMASMHVLKSDLLKVAHHGSATSIRAPNSSTPSNRVGLLFQWAQETRLVTREWRPYDSWKRKEPQLIAPT